MKKKSTYRSRLRPSSILFGDDTSAIADHVLKPLSFTSKSIGSRMAAAGNAGAAIVTHLARSSRSWTDAVIRNWKGLKTREKPTADVHSALLHKAGQIFYHFETKLI